MKLVSVDIEGFRRFRTKQTLKVDGRLVALVGPNEAGKTSVLKAIQSLADKNGFSNSGPIQDISRDESFPQNHRVIAAKFLLESADKEALKEIREATDARWLVVEKLLNGQARYKIYPDVDRDLTLRHQIIKRAKSIVEAGINAGEGLHSSILSRLSGPANEFLSTITDANVGTLTKETVSRLAAFGEALRKASENIYASDIDNLILHEMEPHPRQAAEKTLSQRLPLFILFSEADRDLKSGYNIEPFYAEKDRVQIPQALQNLIDAAGLDLNSVYIAAKAGDRGKVETLISNANTTIEEKLLSAWSQSDACVHFRVDNTYLSILVRSSGGFGSIAERSDGLKQFVALFAFLSKKVRQKQDVVLLVDEIEVHLHYDAQADVVQMLSKQKMARKVIFSTHSIGCFPEDIGTGVKLVEIIREAEKPSSRIIDRFWSHDCGGLAAVLIKMGAATTAFLPVRSCLLVEGPVDMLLLPVLMREAIDREVIGFQISPGLAQASEPQIAILKTLGRRVVFLVDGDDGGKEIKSKLKRAGISDEEIVSLEQLFDQACEIEDFVEKSIFANAINEELGRSGHKQKVDLCDIPDTLRTKAMRKWCENLSIAAPNKVEVAYHILDQIHDSKLVEPAHVEKLQALHKQVEQLFISKE